MKPLERRLNALAHAMRKIPWMLGDSLLRADDRVFQYTTKMRMSDAQLYDLMRMAEQYKPWERLDYQLPWSYFRDLGRDKEKAIPLLLLALKNGWSRDQLRLARKKLDAATEQDPPYFP